MQWSLRVNSNHLTPAIEDLLSEVVLVHHLTWLKSWKLVLDESTISLSPSRWAWTYRIKNFSMRGPNIRSPLWWAGAAVKQEHRPRSRAHGWPLQRRRRPEVPLRAARRGSAAGLAKGRGPARQRSSVSTKIRSAGRSVSGRYAYRERSGHRRRGRHSLRMLTSQDYSVRQAELLRRYYNRQIHLHGECS